MAGSRFGRERLSLVRRDRRRSRAQGTLANIGLVVHETESPNYPEPSASAGPRIDQSVWERRQKRLQERLDRIRREPSPGPQTVDASRRAMSDSANPTSGFDDRAVEGPQSLAREVRFEPQEIVRHVSSSTRPPVCAFCGGVVQIESKWTWCAQVEKTALRWQCVDVDCAGRNVLIVYVSPTSDYARRG